MPKRNRDSDTGGDAPTSPSELLSSSQIDAWQQFARRMNPDGARVKYLPYIGITTSAATAMINLSICDLSAIPMTKSIEPKKEYVNKSLRGVQLTNKKKPLTKAAIRAAKASIPIYEFMAKNKSESSVINKQTAINSSITNPLVLVEPRSQSISPTTTGQSIPSSSRHESDISDFESTSMCQQLLKSIQRIVGERNQNISAQSLSTLHGIPLSTCSQIVSQMDSAGLLIPFRLLYRASGQLKKKNASGHTTPGSHEEVTRRAHITFCPGFEVVLASVNPEKHIPQTGPFPPPRIKLNFEVREYPHLRTREESIKAHQDRQMK